LEVDKVGKTPYFSLTLKFDTLGIKLYFSVGGLVGNYEFRESRRFKILRERYVDFYSMDVNFIML
jgi:hypothetical protein